MLARYVALAAWLTACGPATATTLAREPEASPTVELWRARCGGCHRLVEPRTRTRAAVTAALARHRNRVHLTESQWRELIDFIAPQRDAALQQRNPI